MLGLKLELAGPRGVPRGPGRLFAGDWARQEDSEELPGEFPVCGDLDFLREFLDLRGVAPQEPSPRERSDFPPGGEELRSPVSCSLMRFDAAERALRGGRLHLPADATEFLFLS